MLGYARDEVFTKDQILARVAAVACVHKVTEREPRIRCHELARAVLLRFDSIGKIGPGKWLIADGKCGAVDHSWLYDSSGSGNILDVYCPGREPMVQLIDRFCSLGLYVRADALRTDINGELVHALVAEMRRGHDFLPPKQRLLATDKVNISTIEQLTAERLPAVGESERAE
jgi:hypothetical protein